MKKGASIMEIVSFTKFQICTGLICAFFANTCCYLFGECDKYLEALIIFVVLDYVSGIMSAYVTKTLDSQVGAKGIAKKLMIFILIVTANWADNILGIETFLNLRMSFIGFYLGIEGLSITENAGKMGLPVPKSFMKAMVQFKSKNN